MSNRYRPLLPNTTPGSSSTEDTSGSQSQSSLSGLIKIPRVGTRTACESCRQKKIRCNGGRPMCKRCIETTTDCIYRTDKEEKSILAVEGRNSELRAELEQLLETDRGGTRDLQPPTDKQDFIRKDGHRGTGEAGINFQGEILHD
ncbi:Uncharacterized protein HZ326_25110 [Fusarium oxysporum f. sp. albedinis]|nr:Uncharacterized protein HZ326_25110 [Fusarium oxysporum f. sp. albedinis]